MKKMELQAIYIMWLRQMKRFIRSKSRLLVTVVQPLFFLLILGSGFRAFEIPGLESPNFMYFFAPGIITMAIMFSSMFTGISVLWDKQFGFLQEVMVAPVSRLSIIIGRTLGGATTALIQGFIILIIALALGIQISSIWGLLLAIVIMLLIAFSAVGFGLILASKMQDMQGFPLIMNLVVTPLILVSSAFFPLYVLPSWGQILTKVNPIFYMVDGLRGSLIGMDNVLNPLLDLGVILVICITMLSLGNYFFNKSEV